MTERRKAKISEDIEPQQEASSRLRGRQAATHQEVEDAIRDIQRHHEVGQASLDSFPKGGEYRSSTIFNQAEELRKNHPAETWSETKLRKARQFASLYDKKQLRALCSLIRHHMPQFGVTHVGILVTVSNATQRLDIQRRCIEENWSKAELLSAIKLLRTSHQLQAGRRRRVSSDPGHALVQLQDLIRTWQRWSFAARGPEGVNGVFHEFPTSVRRTITQVDDAVASLHVEVGKQLDKTRERAGQIPDAD